MPGNCLSSPGKTVPGRLVCSSAGRGYGQLVSLCASHVRGARGGRGRGCNTPKSAERVPLIRAFGSHRGNTQVSTRPSQKLPRCGRFFSQLPMAEQEDGLQPCTDMREECSLPSDFERGRHSSGSRRPMKRNRPRVDVKSPTGSKQRGDILGESMKGPEGGNEDWELAQVPATRGSHV